jgi:hypothetical protein
VDFRSITVKGASLAIGQEEGTGQFPGQLVACGACSKQDLKLPDRELLSRVFLWVL